ncbi:adaptin N terminal region-domain-containing protein [Scheffersomyces coipomensis]|uniref:adaptin N terminal region-domain-containing protein n=1 Tax=Scheffersomyces coipomensis TaxID=1788519 RepID=UPI00315D3F60
MKGLTQFIVDLRNSKDTEEESKRINLEINNIQTKFNSDSSLNSYQRKKYLCKLVYIYLNGYYENIDIGLNQALLLIKSQIYTEKQLGYLSISILGNKLTNANSSIKDNINNLLHLTHADLIKDLQSNNEDFNCLAIQFIASNFNIHGNTTFIEESDESALDWLQLIDMVYSFVTSPIHKSIVKRKAVIALYSLIKLYPNVIITNNNWIPRLLTLIDDQDFDVLISSIALIEYIIQLKPQYIKSIIPAISSKLHSIIIEDKCPQEYYYYKIPAPWLVVGLLQLIEQIFLMKENDHSVFSISDIDDTTLNNLRHVVSKSISNASVPIKGLPNRNSQSSILFQAVSLAIFLDASEDAINGAINALMSLLNSADTNTRYLALDALIKLTSRSNLIIEVDDIKIPKLFQLLNDKDISIKRKALDLLYTTCTPLTYTGIINRLLDYFPYAEFSLKSELAIKIAILSEKFATDSTWYVTTMLKLLSISGGSNSNGISYIGNEVWERIIQIIVNNESLQKKSGKLIINLLRNPLVLSNGQSSQPIAMGLSESLIKVAAFLLGEYGYLNPDDINLQFQLLYDAYFKVSLITRAILLTTFLKFLVKFPDFDFVPEIIDLFEIESKSIDLEIQTRSCEYLKLATIQSNFILANKVIKPLPAFRNVQNPLIHRIGGYHDLNRSRSTIIGKSIKKNTTAAGGLASEETVVGADDSVNGADDTNPFDDSKTTTALSPNWYQGYYRMLHFDAGIFYENPLIKLTYRVIKEGSNILLRFTVINNSKKTAGTDITKFTVLELESKAGNKDPSYLLNLKQVPESTIEDKSNLEIEIKVRGIVENNESPVLSLTFTCGGSFNQLHLKFPVLLIRTLSATALGSSDDFEKRWLQIGNLLGTKEGESINIVKITSNSFSYSNIIRLLSRLGFAIVYTSPETTPNDLLIKGAGILHTQKSNYGVLTQIQSVNSDPNSYKIMVRCTGGGISEVIALTLKEILEEKI